MTMIELVIVMVLISVLAIVAIPRLDSDGLRVAPLAERMAAEIRYAQNLAFTRSESHTFVINTSAGSYSILRGGTPVALSSGEASGSLDGASVSGLASVTFEPRFGRPYAGGSIDISAGGGNATITIEGETGYVQVVD